MRLPDDVVIKNLADIHRRGHPVRGLQAGCLCFLTDDVHAQLDAFIADEHGRARNELAHLMLAFATKTTIQGVLAVAGIIRHFAPHLMSPRPFLGM